MLGLHALDIAMFLIYLVGFHRHLRGLFDEGGDAVYYERLVITKGER